MAISSYKFRWIQHTDDCVTRVKVVFYAGDIEPVTALNPATGKEETKDQYVRARIVDERLYTINGEIQMDELCQFFNQELLELPENLEPHPAQISVNKSDLKPDSRISLK